MLWWVIEDSVVLQTAGRDNTFVKLPANDNKSGKGFFLIFLFSGKFLKAIFLFPTLEDVQNAFS